jgi:hypothetical protein
MTQNLDLHNQSKQSVKGYSSVIGSRVMLHLAIPGRGKLYEEKVENLGCTSSAVLQLTTCLQFMYLNVGWLF